MDFAMKSVCEIRSVFQIVPLDDYIVDRAIAAVTWDFEDAIQVAAAAKVKADFIVTRNLKHFAPFVTQAITAEEMVTIVEPI